MQAKSESSSQTSSVPPQASQKLITVSNPIASQVENENSPSLAAVKEYQTSAAVAEVPQEPVASLLALSVEPA